MDWRLVVGMTANGSGWLGCWLAQMWARRRALLALAVVLLAGVGATGARPVDAQTTNTIKPFFYGTAYIAGRPADDGVFVDVLVVRGANDYTVCGKGEVSRTPLFDLGPGFSGPGRYITPIDTTPECIRPGTRYTIFVNEVWGGTAYNPGFSSRGGQARWDAYVSEVALETQQPRPSDGTIDRTVPVVYFYGAAWIGRDPAKPDTTVRVVSEDGSCSGEGQTRDLFWEPQAAPDRPVGMRGFYVAAIQMDGACADRPLRYLFYVNGMLAGSKFWNTPPYGIATRFDPRASVQR